MPKEETVAHLFDVINNRDLDRFKDLFTQGAEFYFPKTQPLLGRDQIMRFFKILFRRYPELSFQVRKTILQGEWAAVHWTNRGIRKDGEAYQNEGVTIVEMEGEKIRFMSDFFKDTGF